MLLSLVYNLLLLAYCVFTMGRGNGKSKMNLAEAKGKENFQGSSGETAPVLENLSRNGGKGSTKTARKGLKKPKVGLVSVKSWLDVAQGSITILANTSLLGTLIGDPIAIKKVRNHIRFRWKFLRKGCQLFPLAKNWIELNFASEEDKVRGWSGWPFHISLTRFYSKDEYCYQKDKEKKKDKLLHSRTDAFYQGFCFNCLNWVFPGVGFGYNKCKEHPRMQTITKTMMCPFSEPLQRGSYCYVLTHINFLNHFELLWWSSPLSAVRCHCVVWVQWSNKDSGTTGGEVRVESKTILERLKDLWWKTLRVSPPNSRIGVICCVGFENQFVTAYKLDCQVNLLIEEVFGIHVVVVLYTLYKSKLNK